MNYRKRKLLTRLQFVMVDALPYMVVMCCVCVIWLSTRVTDYYSYNNIKKEIFKDNEQVVVTDPYSKESWKFDTVDAAIEWAYKNTYALMPRNTLHEDPYLNFVGFPIEVTYEKDKPSGIPPKL